MDEMTTYAVCATVHADDGEAERWFGALIGAYQGLENPGDWDGYRAALDERGSADGIPPVTVEEFVTWMEQQPGPMDIIRDLADQNPDELLAVYRGWLAQAAQEQEAGDAPAQEEDAWEAEAREQGAGEAAAEDEAAWYEFLRENGRYWDRTPESWEQFRTWFLYTAAEANVATLATNFLDWAQEQPNPAAVFVEYGVTFDVAAGDPEAVEAEAVEAEAVETEAVETEAVETEAVETEAVAAGAEGEQDLSAGDLAALFGEEIDVDQAVEAVKDDVLAGFRAENPEFAAMPDDEVLALLREVMAETAG